MLCLLILSVFFINAEACWPCPHHTTTSRPITTVATTLPSSPPEISTPPQPDTPPRPLTTVVGTSPSSETSSVPSAQPTTPVNVRTQPPQ
ncbi:hypothetical protein Y032_0691g1570 [Ancylostoma ceylanicum]|uniref:Uncharacterized protein n=1 Tax=Ancylostoma ceylanicum TaxID=53326 RepID=A0A016WG85_9BILA|nr:hypothetical protein Y032_0691g1570 [Ancylostoma ceylanicum]